MTDPIEQAREDLKWGGRRCECSECDTEFLAKIATFEQVIRLHDPDVVRLVQAARALAGCGWVNETISPQVDDLYAALDPFKEVQE